jgi:hypothetical protein
MTTCNSDKMTYTDAVILGIAAIEFGATKTTAMWIMLGCMALVVLRDLIILWIVRKR